MLADQTDGYEWRVDRVEFDRGLTSSTEKWIRNKGVHGYVGDDLFTAVPALHRSGIAFSAMNQHMTILIACC